MRLSNIQEQHWERAIIRDKGIRFRASFRDKMVGLRVLEFYREPIFMQKGMFESDVNMPFCHNL